MPKYPRGRPISNTPAPKANSDCTIPAALLNPARQGNTVVNTVAGGSFFGGTITVNGQNNLTSDVSLVSEGDITINGTIAVAPQNPGANPIDITIISVNGNVYISPGAQVSGGVAPAGSDDVSKTLPAKANSKAGRNGGLVRIIGVNIDVHGYIFGADGGPGGKAEAVPQVPVGVIGVPASAEAGAGCGGYGGDVLLCAKDSIHVAAVSSGPTIVAGGGGVGGTAIASSDLGNEARAAGGDSSDSGDVIFRGTGANLQIFIDQAAEVLGGDPNFTTGSCKGGKGKATVKGFQQAHDGGKAEAWSGEGGKGGTVIFKRCRVNPTHGAATGGKGGDGGRADAVGGAADSGQPGHANGFRGGAATSEGGQGGAKGRAPAIPLTSGAIDKGKSRGPGKGGTATAESGAGGAGFGAGRNGGSEPSNAMGGKGGDGRPGQKQTDPNGGPIAATGGP